MPGKTRQASSGDFQLLGLRFGAPPEEVKKAYKAFVKTWHPDLFAQGSPKQQRAEERLKDVNAAYRRIRNDWEAEVPESKPEPRSPTPPPERHQSKPATGTSGVPSASLSWFLKRGWEQVRTAVRAPFPKTSQPSSKALRSWMVFLLFLSLLGTLIFMEPSPVPDHRSKPLHSPKRDTPPPALPDPVLPEATAPSETPDQAPVTSQQIPDDRSPALDPEPASQERTFFTLGSSKGEVLRIQGKPAKVYGQTWVYGLSDITFRDGRVWRYHNFDGTLRVQIVPSVSTQNRHNLDSFSLGATRDVVLQVQGTPTHIEGNKWSYGFSEVYFKDGIVVGFNNFFNNLKIAMRPSQGFQTTPAKGYFTVGSSRDEVLAVQGTPTVVQGNLWSYQLSDVLFVDGKVRTANDFSGILKYFHPDAVADGLEARNPQGIPP